MPGRFVQSAAKGACASAWPLDGKSLGPCAHRRFQHPAQQSVFRPLDQQHRALAVGDDEGGAAFHGPRALFGLARQLFLDATRMRQTRTLPWTRPAVRLLRANIARRLDPSAPGRNRRRAFRVPGLAFARAAAPLPSASVLRSQTVAQSPVPHWRLRRLRVRRRRWPRLRRRCRGRSREACAIRRPFAETARAIRRPRPSRLCAGCARGRNSQGRPRPRAPRPAAPRPDPRPAASASGIRGNSGRRPARWSAAA